MKTLLTLSSVLVLALAGPTRPSMAVLSMACLHLDLAIADKMEGNRMEAGFLNHGQSQPSFVWGTNTTG